MSENEKKPNMMLVPSEEAFALSKVKRLKDGGGLEVVYEVTEVIGTEAYTNTYTVKSAKNIHPDLRKLFDELRPIFGRTFNMTSFLSMMETPDFKATKKQKDTARQFAEEALKNIDVRGISMSGKDDNVGCILTGVLTTTKNLKACLNTPRIKFSTEIFGFEEELDRIAGEIERETYAFLFKGKKAELDLFNPDGEATDEARVDSEEAEDEGEEFPEVPDPADDM